MRGQPKTRGYNTVENRIKALDAYTRLAEGTTDPKAVERFKRPVYQVEHCDVAGYLAKKYNIKGEMRSGQKNLTEVQAE